MEKKRPSKILHVIPGFGGGVASHVWNLSKSVDPSKIIFDVISFSETPHIFNMDIENMGGQVFVLPGLRKNGLFKFIRNYQKILKENGPYDMIHLHQSEFRAMLLASLAKLAGIKRSAIHSHISDKQNSKRLLFRAKMILYHFINTHSTSDLVSCSKMASSYLYGQKVVDKNIVMHIPNSIVVEKFIVEKEPIEISKFKKEHQIDSKSLIIGHIGFFGYQKNHEFMVKIIKEMVDENIDFVWLFLGEGPNINTIKEQIQEANCEKYVRFLGRRNDVSFIFTLMDVMTLPSHFEGLPTVAIEAQAAGVPSVISNKVTPESDMEIGIMKFVPINNEKIWVNSIVEMSRLNIPPAEKRKEALEKKYFTSETAAKIYEGFVLGKIKHYNLGD